MKNLFHDLDKIVTLRASEKETPGARPGSGNSRGGSTRRRCVHVVVLCHEPSVVSVGAVMLPLSGRQVAVQSSPRPQAR